MNQRLFGATFTELLFAVQLCLADHAQVFPAKAMAIRAVLGDRNLAATLTDAAFRRAALDQRLHVLI